MKLVIFNLFGSLFKYIKDSIAFSISQRLRQNAEILIQIRGINEEYCFIFGRLPNKIAYRMEQVAD